MSHLHTTTCKSMYHTHTRAPSAENIFDLCLLYQIEL